MELVKGLNYNKEAKRKELDAGLLASVESFKFGPAAKQFAAI